MEKSHTPGPWNRNIAPAKKYPVIFAGRNTHVARIIPTGRDDEDEANANIIAAAPSMLAVLEAIREDIGENEQPAREAVEAAIYLARHGRRKPA